MEIKWLKWEDLTKEEKEQAIESYAYFREEEEEVPCSRERAEESGWTAGAFKRDGTFAWKVEFDRRKINYSKKGKWRVAAVVDGSVQKCCCWYFGG